MQSLWYTSKIWYIGLIPVSWVFRLCVYLRKKLYEAGIFKQYQAKVPVIVVGNITVGGTGKTPLVQAMVPQLLEKGFYPGIVSLGYKAKRKTKDPILVTENSYPKNVGDEPVLLAQSSVPVVIAKSRSQAIDHLLAK